MEGAGEGPRGVSLDGLLKAVIGYAGTAMCITLVFLSMRAVMDVGGACADGGPYVVAQSCPQGSTITLLGGIFGGIVFVLIAAIGGAEVGGIWAGAPLFAWAGLFGTLGWNFMEYGVFNAPAETGINGGWALCGILFWIMAAGGLVGLLPAFGDKPGKPGRAETAGAIPGLGQPAHRPIVISASGTPVTVSQDGRTITVSGTVIDGELPDGLQDELALLREKLAEARASGQTEASRDQLAQIAADFGAVIGTAMAGTPMTALPGTGDGTTTPGAPTPPGGTGTGATAGTGVAHAEPEPEFTEGTQALLDRLERLADMRDRGLLAPDEYDTAKARIMAALEGRT